MRPSFYPIFKISHIILVIIAIAFPLYFMFCSHFFFHIYMSAHLSISIWKKYTLLKKKNLLFICLYPNSQTVLPGLLCRAYYSLGLSTCASLFCFTTATFTFEQRNHTTPPWLHSHLMGMKSEALRSPGLHVLSSQAFLTSPASPPHHTDLCAALWTLQATSCMKPLLIWMSTLPILWMLSVILINLSSLL